MFKYYINMTPVKLIKITDRILYNKDCQYNMFSLAQKKFLGTIKLTPRKDSLYISNMKSKFPENKELKVGTSLINFAKKLSKKMGYKGNLSVVAYNTEYGGKQPHKFYRKQGFTTNDSRIDDMIDFCNQCNIDIPPTIKHPITMNYKG